MENRIYLEYKPVNISFEHKLKMLNVSQNSVFYTYDNEIAGVSRMIRNPTWWTLTDIFTVKDNKELLVGYFTMSSFTVLDELAALLIEKEYPCLSKEVRPDRLILDSKGIPTNNF